MSKEPSRSLGIRPEIFNTIDTPIIPTSIGIVTEGIPTFGSLDVLIAYLTAANSVNYEATSDFLMVFRSFSSPEEIWRLLASRLLWAADLAARNGFNSETGNNVGTRCFVMIKMWFRKYFIVDFMPSAELRSLVAESLTVLAACTEFVLAEHFSLIMLHLRREWDSQVSRYWILPDDIAGNVETPVPMGGSPLTITNDQTKRSYILDGSIPIDADIAVPRISTSPRKQKPKKKISTLFGLKGTSNMTDEVFLHNKVDILAMKVINEYHERDHRNMSSLHHTIKEIGGYPQSPIESPLGNSGLNSHSYSDSEVIPGSTPRRNNTTENIHSSFKGSDENALLPSDSLGEAYVASLASVSSSRSSSIDLESPPTTNNSVLKTPTRSFSVISRNPKLTETKSFDQSMQGETHHDAVNTDDDDEVGWATSVRFSEQLQEDQLQDTNYEETKGMSHEPSSDTLNVNNMILANTTGDSVFEEFMQSKNNTGNTSTQNLEQTEQNHNDLSLEVTQSPQERQQTSEVPRASTSTLNADEWNADLNYDELERVSFVGSTLSTLSTSTRSAFSAHVPLTPRENRAQFHSSSESSHSISLMSEVENSLLQPCEGYTPMDAARLRSLPDTKLEGDALLATLNKLEGIIPEVDFFEGNKSTDAVPLQLVNDVMGLGISTNSQINPSHHKDQQDIFAAKEYDGSNNTNMSYPIGHNGHSTQRQLKSQPYLQDHFGTHTINNINKRSMADVENSNNPTLGKHSDAHSGEGIHSCHEIQSRSLTPIQTPETSYHQPDIPSALPTLHIGLPGSTHAPFILSYNAREVAEQMTIIEKEIAKELECQELILVTAPYPQADKVTSWMQVVMDEPPLKGVELVIARFNLVYKWAQSEVLLCPTAALQAQAVSRFIHIAFEALRLQNFATMVQLVLALSSSEVESKLGMEYANLLPSHDRNTLDLLQSLISPANNYRNLRKAHERFKWSKGCIPYTLMFLNDIVEISKSAPFNAANEIHFGKYHEIAKVTQSLISCVVSGERYSLEPNYALISKCLHIASA